MFNEQRDDRIGHVFFTRIAPKTCRDGGKTHEIHEGFYVDQWSESEGTKQVRCDCALRLWGRGQDGELASYADSDQEYNELLYAPPRSWNRFPTPSFGNNG